MNVYIYCDNIYCEDCGIKIKADCIASGKYPKNIVEDDSYEFPKGPYPDGGGAFDCPQHCGSGSKCVNAYTPKGWDTKVGVFLENDLTSDGIDNVVTSFINDIKNPTVCIEHVKYYANCGYNLKREYHGVTVRLS